jgi:hypothetical protein
MFPVLNSSSARIFHCLNLGGHPNRLSAHNALNAHYFTPISTGKFCTYTIARTECITFARKTLLRPADFSRPVSLYERHRGR